MDSRSIPATPPPSRRSEPRLFGRDHDLREIRDFLVRARTRGGALVVAGEPGAGKTAFATVCAATAAEEGFRVLWASGVESEVDVPFSTLNQALAPVRTETPALPDPDREALDVALGFADGPPADRAAVASATLSLLRRVARTQPVLLVVDDVPWLDRSSAAVLGVVARRLSGKPIAFLGTSRTKVRGFFDTAGLPEHVLAPLDRRAASDLLDARHPALAPSVRRRVLTESEGNPLALGELPRAIRASPGGAAALPGILPLTGRLQALFRARVLGLPPPTRAVLLLMALEGAEVVALGPYAGSRVLAPAERAHLIERGGDGEGGPRFCHPLIRSAVVELSSSVERRVAHRTLAELLVHLPDRRAWHLAAATAGTDESVAALLDETAGRSLARGDATGAAAALTRAAELSLEASDRGRRLAEAAYVGAGLTGDWGSAIRWLADSRETDLGPSGSLRAATAASIMLNGEGGVDAAHRILAMAVRTYSDRVASDPASIDATAVDAAVSSLLDVCLAGQRADLWEDFAATTAPLMSVVHPDLRMLAAIVSDPVRVEPSVLGELDEAIRHLDEEGDPIRIVQVGVAASTVDRLEECRHALMRVMEGSRQGEAIVAGARASMHLCIDGFATGRWAEAPGLADEGSALVGSFGITDGAWPFRIGTALIAAARGDDDAVGAVTERMVRWSIPRGVRAAQLFAARALALAAVGRGDHEAAFQHATALSPAGSLTSHPQALWSAMDLVEAAVRTGRKDEARAHVAALRAADVARLSPRLAMIVSGSAALAAEDARADGFFTDALAVPGADRWPFDLARVELCFGEHLRRTRRISEARGHLAAAFAVFSRLGAAPWQERAAAELRATGRTAVRGASRGAASLTAQEMTIATLAASGLTNRQIGERLMLSPRTVGAHLYRAFPKLGVTSRAGLRDALERGLDNRTG